MGGHVDVTEETEPVPGECPHELLVEFGGAKSLCTLLGAGVWTNCRQRGACTLWRFRGKPTEEDDGDGVQE